MSMKVDPDRIAAGELTFLEAKYLQDRGQLPDGYEMPDAPNDDGEDGPVVQSRVTPIEDQTVPSIGSKGGIVNEDEEEDYEEGWNNDQRRAALSERGLSVEGNKSELIGRLRRSDLDELDDGDVFEA